MQYRFRLIDAECLTESKMLPGCDGNYLQYPLSNKSIVSSDLWR